MQATAMSNPTTVNTPNATPAGAPVLPFDPRQASPFTAVFQAALKDTVNSGKLPAPGKAQDSSRGLNNSTRPDNNSIGLSQSVFAAPILPPNLTGTFPPVAVLQPLGSIAQTSKSSGKSVNPTVPFSLEQSVPAGGNLSHANVAEQMSSGSASSFIQQVPAGLSVNPSEPSSLPQQLPGATPLAASNFNPRTAANPSLTAVRDSAANAALSPVQDSAATPLQSTSQVSVANGAVIPSQDSAANPSPSAIQYSDAAQIVPTGATTLQKASPDLTSSTDPASVFLPPAAEQATPFAHVANSRAASQEPASTQIQPGFFNKLFQSLAQPNIATAAPQLGPQNIPTSGANPLVDKAAQTALEDSKFLKMQTPNLADAAVKVLLPDSAQSAAAVGAQSNLQAPLSTSLAPVETSDQSAAKLAAVGVQTPKIIDNMKLQSDNSAPAAPVALVSPKAQSQGVSNGAAGNDSNPKPDHVPNLASAQQDGKGFVQTLVVAAANPTGTHVAGADPTAVAAAVPNPTPALAQSAVPGAQLAAPSTANSRSAEFLQHSSEGTAVVNSAHLLVQPGQTEIRIEMQADSLGSVELRAHIAGDQIAASISVEHHDAQVALTTDLPALHSALAEKNLHVGALTVSQGTFSSLSGGLGQDTGHRGFTHMQPPAQFAYLEHEETTQPFVETPAGWTGPAIPGAGLSVVA